MFKIESIVSYTLAAMAGICFVTGVAILTHEGGVDKYGYGRF